MKIVGIENNVVITIFDWAKVVEDITVLPEGITADYAPDYVVAGFTVEDGKYIAPVQSGWEYDYQDNRYYPHDQYRKILHQRTSNDTLQALRKLRDGDQSYDWQAWLDKLDAYNKAIEDTQLQETYPDKVVYPEYPQR